MSDFFLQWFQLVGLLSHIIVDRIDRLRVLVDLTLQGFVVNILLGHLQFRHITQLRKILKIVTLWSTICQILLDGRKCHFLSTVEQTLIYLFQPFDQVCSCQHKLLISFLTRGSTRIDLRSYWLKFADILLELRFLCGDNLWHSHCFIESLLWCIRVVNLIR